MLLYCRREGSGLCCCTVKGKAVDHVVVLYKGEQSILLLYCRKEGSGSCCFTVQGKAVDCAVVL